MQLRWSRYLQDNCILFGRATFVHQESACSLEPRFWIFLLSYHLSRSYNEAMATIRRVPSVEHNFQLVITRVYEDGDQELLEDEEESESYILS